MSYRAIENYCCLNQQVKLDMARRLLMWLWIAVLLLGSCAASGCVTDCGCTSFTGVCCLVVQENQLPGPIGRDNSTGITQLINTYTDSRYWRSVHDWGLGLGKLCSNFYLKCYSQIPTHTAYNAFEFTYNAFDSTYNAQNSLIKINPSLPVAL